jgi:protein O-mannosyl-transferase
MTKKTKKERKQEKSVEKQQASSKTTPWLIGAIAVFVLSFLFYLPTADYALTHLDDNKHILDHAELNSDMANIPATFSNVYYGKFYRPVLSISYIIDTNLLGNEFADYHLSNIAMHALGAALVFLVLIAMGYKQINSLLLSVFFALHPILTPAVSWIPGRNDSLLGIMIFSSFLFLVLYIKNQKDSKSLLYLILHIIFYMGALFTKEVSAVFPFVCFAYIIFTQTEKIVNSRNLTLGALWFVGGLVWFFMRQAALADLIGKGAEFGFGVFLESFQVIFAQAGKILLPYRMVAFSSVEMIAVISGLVLLGGLAFMAYKQKDDGNYYPWFGLVWFILFVLPPLFFKLSFADEFMDFAEHRTYVPLLGVIICIAEILRYYKVDFKKPIAIAVAAVLIIAFGAKAYSYQSVFEGRVPFWTHSTEIYPEKSRAYSDLGIVYFDSKDYKTAEKHFLEAYEINSDDPYANFNLGKCYSKMNQFEKSLYHYEKAVKTDLNPVWNIDIGVAYVRLNRLEEGIASYKKALAVLPNNANAHLNIGAAYAMSNQGGIAQQHWRQAIQLEPNQWGAYNNLIRYYYSIQDYKTSLLFADQMQQRRGKFDKDVLQYIQYMRQQGKKK